MYKLFDTPPSNSRRQSLSVSEMITATLMHLYSNILIGSTSENSPKPRYSKKNYENAIAISMNILNLTLHYNYIAKKLKTQKVMKNMIK